MTENTSKNTGVTYKSHSSKRIQEPTGSLSKIKSKGFIVRSRIGQKKSQVSRDAKNKTRTLLSLVAVQKSIVFRGAIALVDMSGAGNDLRHMIMEAVDSAV